MTPVWILLGAPGAGKSSQGRRLAERGYHYISTGDLLRQRHDPQLEAVMERGELVASAVVDEALEQVITTLSDRQSIVIDGFPRELSEAAWLAEHLPDWGCQLAGAISLQVSPPVALSRLQQRGRTDDTDTSVAERLELYTEQTQPVIDYYRQQGKLVEIPADGNVEEVATKMDEVMGA